MRALTAICTTLCRLVWCFFFVVEPRTVPMTLGIKSILCSWSKSQPCSGERLQRNNLQNFIDWSFSINWNSTAMIFPIGIAGAFRRTWRFFAATIWFIRHAFVNFRAFTSCTLSRLSYDTKPCLLHFWNPYSLRFNVWALMFASSTVKTRLLNHLSTDTRSIETSIELNLHLWHSSYVIWQNNPFYQTCAVESAALSIDFLLCALVNNSIIFLLDVQLFTQWIRQATPMVYFSNGCTYKKAVRIRSDSKWKFLKRFGLFQ